MTLASLLVSAPVSQCSAQSRPCPPEQIQRLMPPCERVGIFGESVSLVDDVLVVGAGDPQGGRIKLFSFDVGSRQWQADVEIPHPNPQQYDDFGRTIELHHDAATDTWLLAVGVPGRDTFESNDGMCYIFVRHGLEEWTLETSLLPFDPVESGDFGGSVKWVTAAGRTFLVIASPGGGGPMVGTVDVFERDENGVWSHQSRIESPNGPRLDGGFGYGLGAAEGNGETILVIGEPTYNNYYKYEAPGDVYCYHFDPATEYWIFEQHLEAPDPYDRDRFGWDISVGATSGEPGVTHRVLVGRPGEGSNIGQTDGAAYVYSRSIDGVWTLEDHIPYPMPHGATDAEFGEALQMDVDGAAQALIAAPADSRFGRYSGAAFRAVRDPATGAWTVAQGLFGREQAKNNGYGSAVALGQGATAGTAVVGALGTQCPGEVRPPNVGAAYSFDLNPGQGGTCPPPVLRLQQTPDCANGRGGELEVRWVQATPDQRARIAILFGKRTGHFAIPNGNPCAGTELGLSAQALQVAFVRSAGQFGAGRLTTTIPRSACGGYLQLLDITRCELSNVVRIE